MKMFSSAVLASVAVGAFLAAPASATVTVSSDPILYWNQLTYTSGTSLPGGPPQVARLSAMVNIAMFDAVNAALGSPNTPYLTGVSASGGDVRAAAAQAAHDVLVAVNPAQTAQYDAALASSLALVSDAGARATGVATGSAYATAILTARANDGSATAQIPYVPTGAPGNYVPTSPSPAVLPGWGDVTPFLMTSGDQFRAGPPPALDSAQYAAAFNEVKDIGALNSATRTADQTAAALFWANAGGTSWIQIGVDMAADDGRSTLDNARLFAILGTSLADAFIAGFDTKYTYDFWRPVTAIHNAEFDGNPLTADDDSWASLITAPNHPSYFSTHSIADGTAASILLALLGDGSFCETFGGLSRCFSSIEQASLEGANSRLWGGIHFRFDSEAGLTAGQNIGHYALGLQTFQAVPEPSTWAMMLLGFGVVGFAVRRARRDTLPQIA